jgi:hypothetical protein
MRARFFSVASFNGCVANSGEDARAVGGTGFELRGDAKESVNELALSDHIALR